MDRKNTSLYAWRPYVFAIVVIAAAAALRLWALHGLGMRYSMLTFYPAVMVVALYGGFSAGMLGTFLSCLAILFVLPLFVHGPFIRDSLDWLGLAVFFATCTMISSIAGAMRRGQAREKQAEAELETLNASLELRGNQLEATNKSLESTAKAMDLLNEMGNLLLTPLSAEEAFSIIKQYGPQLFPIDSGELFVYRASRNVLDGVAAWGEPLGWEHWFAPEECWALRLGKLHQVNDSRSALACAHAGATGLTSYLCVPLMAQGESLGVFHLRMPRGQSAETAASEDGLSEAKQRLTISFVERIALALANLNLRETLRNQSIRDALTGLLNRRYLDESLDREIRRASRKARSVGAIMMDLDHFKSVNDTFGHDAGDTVLREMGNFLQQNTRKEDIACRYGGEEFLIILTDTTLDGLQQRAEHLRTAVKTLHVTHRGQLLNALTMSVGVASFPEHASTAETLLRAADSALYRAKHEGRDRVVLASVALAQSVPSHSAKSP